MTQRQNAIDAVLALRTGDKFRINGREFTIYGGCVSHYEGRSTFKVWNSKHAVTTVSVRTNSNVEVVQ